MDKGYRIVDATAEHVRLLGTRLRVEDQIEVTSAGLTPKQAVWRSWRHALIRRTAFIGDEIAAMWGVNGTVLGNTGNPWLLTTSAIEKMPLAFLKEARREVGEMLEGHPVLSNHVAASYTRAIRFLRLLGFTVDEPRPFGPLRAPFCRFHMVRGSRGVTVRKGDPIEDFPAILAGARAFASSIDASDILPPLDSDPFSAAVLRSVQLPGATVFLAEENGVCVGGLGVLVAPFFWNTEEISADELFWWVRPGANPRAAGLLFRAAMSAAKEAGASIVSFSELISSPAGVGRVYKRAGMRPMQTVYIGRM